jgi:hypothetical protein
MRVVDETIEQMLNRARGLKGEDAQKAYVEILSRDPLHFAALNELAILAYETGHRSAARTLYEQAVRSHPQNAFARVNLGNLLYEAAEADAAQPHFEAALALDGNLAEAHQGLARILADRGDSEASDVHWRKSFSGQAIVTRRYRGAPPGIALLLLVSARGGNIPMLPFLDERIFAVTALYAEYYDPALPLPPHALLFNSIGDADLCGEALARAVEIAARSDAPIANPPDRVQVTGRAENARRLGGPPDVIAPEIQSFARSAPPDDLNFPLLLRAPGFHTGQHFLRVESHASMDAAIAELPGEVLLAIEWRDTRGADGLFRKYRVMLIGGELYPLHLAISRDWKVHYFTTDMQHEPAWRAEEQRFLDDMPAVLGPRALAALERIAQGLGLDYAGVDFALNPDGALLLFEANATMVLAPPDPDSLWDYRRASIEQARSAAARMLAEKAR